MLITSWIYSKSVGYPHVTPFSVFSNISPIMINETKMGLMWKNYSQALFDSFSIKNNNVNMPQTIYRSFRSSSDVPRFPVINGPIINMRNSVMNHTLKKHKIYLFGLNFWIYWIKFIQVRIITLLYGPGGLELENLTLYLGTPRINLKMNSSQDHHVANWTYDLFSITSNIPHFIQTLQKVIFRIRRSPSQ